MTALDEVGLIAAREIRKNLRSLKGAILIGLSLLGALVWAVIQLKIQDYASSKAPEGTFTVENIRQAQEAALERVYDDAAMVKYVAAAPVLLYGLLWTTLWLCPLVVTILGFDSISADLQHRGVRYWSVRARRASYFVGKVLGLWGVVAALTLVMHALIWGVTIVKGGVISPSPGETLKWGAHFYLTTLPVSGAWCALGVLCSSQFRSPIAAILTTCAAFAGLFLLRALGSFQHLTALLYIYPSWYDELLLSPRADRIALGLVGCFGIASLATAIGSFLFSRSDV